MNAPHPQSHEARLIAARRFIEADAVLTQAMRDGINFHGAVSGMVAAEDELRAAMSEHPAGVKTGAPDLLRKAMLLADSYAADAVADAETGLKGGELRAASSRPALLEFLAKHLYGVEGGE